MKELLAPNGKPSNLTPEQYRLVRTPAFKQWFGDWEKLILTKLNDSGIDEVSLKRLEDVVSKVVDVNGEPLPVYHGTNADFTIFDLKYFGKTDDGFYGKGFYFTPNYESAEVYSSTSEWDKINNTFKEDGKIFQFFLNLRNPIIIDLKKFKIKNETGSNDSKIIIPNSIFSGNTEYLAFEPTQIKLADGTNTTFDVNNHDIRFADGGEADKEKLIKKTYGWYSSFKDRYYKNLNSAYSDIERVVENNNKQFGSIFGNDNPKDIINLFNFNETKKGIEIKPKIKKPQIKKVIEYNTDFDLVNKQKQIWEYSHGIEMGRYLSKLQFIDTNDKRIYGTEKPEEKNIILIINKLKNGDEFPPILLDYDFGILDGHHRFEASKRLKIKKIPVIMYEYPDMKFDGGGRTISQTPAPKKDQIKGSEKNKEGSSKDTSSAKQIKFSDELLEKIQNSVDKHNEKHSNKKISLDSAKAVVRRGMGAYSSTHRPTISGGNPNSRVAWGLARLNAFLYKIVNGKSKSGKYSQDNDLIEELGYKVQKYSDGGDVQAYEEAMGISEFAEGGEAKPKKVYVSIRLPYESEYINDEKGIWIGGRYQRFDEKAFDELKNQKLAGLVGVSSSPNNVAEWFVHRDCLIVMNYDEFIALNETETINYYDPYQLMKNNLFLFKRLYANVSARSGNDESPYVFMQTLKKILEKIIPEINLEMNVAEGQKYKELYRISEFLSPYITSEFPDWLEKNEVKISSPIDLTNAILEFNKLSNGASYLGYGFENPVLTFDELLPFVEKGVVRAGSIYDSEQEIILTNRELNIPKNSQLFFIGKDELGKTRESNKLELIEEFKLKDLYKIHFVDLKDVEKYRAIWLKKEEEKFNKKLETGKAGLELKKEQVINEILNDFLYKSLGSIREQYEKDYISEYSELKEFYDNESDDYEEILWYDISLVQFIIDKYIEIVKSNWKRFIASKSVKDLNLYSFSNFCSEVEYELKDFFEKNKEKLEKISDYRENKGNGYLSLYGFEQLLKKSVNHYESLPEWFDYKKLSKLYLEKMGGEIYRYYDKKDLPLISQYKDGGEADELNLTKNKKNNMSANNPKDTVTMNIPLLIRFSELMREEIKTDVALHEVIENLLDIKDKGVLTMRDYDSIVGSVLVSAENNGVEPVEQEKMESKFEEGGRVQSIHSKKGDIKVSLDDNWYSDDSDVELVPVSELIKFREFDRKTSPKYNKENSLENINHLKYMFQKDGVKSPIIIEYSANDNAVLIIEGNHRLNSAIDLGMEYLPARVVLKKHGNYSPLKLKNTMKVVGIKPNVHNYIPSNLKPSYVGIAGAKPIVYAEGGIIEGRLHSECGEDGCGRKFQVGENGHIIEAERDEAVIVADAFDSNDKMTVKGTPSEIASALNVIGGGKNFDKGAKIVEGGREKELPEMKKEATNTDVDDVIDSGSVIINRRSMADEKEYKVTGTPKQIASAINSIDGNGVVIEKGAVIE